MSARRREMMLARAQMALRTGRLADAERAMREAHGADPAHPAPRLALARLLLLRDRTAELEALLLPCLDSPAAGVEARLLLAEALAPGETAEHHLLAVLKGPAREADACQAAQLLGERCHRPDLAADALTALLARSGGSASAWVLAGDLLRRSGRPSAKPYQQALTLEPKRPEALHGLAMVLAVEGALEKAVTLLETALASCQDDPQLFHDYGLLLLRQGRIDAARGLLQRARALAPDLPWAETELGRGLA